MFGRMDYTFPTGFTFYYFLLSTTEKNWILYSDMYLNGLEI